MFYSFFSRIRCLFSSTRTPSSFMSQPVMDFQQLLFKKDRAILPGNCTSSSDTRLRYSAQKYIAQTLCYIFSYTQGREQTLTVSVCYCVRFLLLLVHTASLKRVKSRYSVARGRRSVSFLTAAIRFVSSRSRANSVGRIVPSQRHLCTWIDITVRSYHLTNLFDYCLYTVQI